MAITKTEVISVRVLPDITAAQAERRSLAAMLDVMVPAHCRAHGHPPAPAPAPAPATDPGAVGRR